MVYQLSFTLHKNRDYYEYFRVLSRSVVQYLRYKWMQGEDEYILAYDKNELRFFVSSFRLKGKTKVLVRCYEPFGVLIFKVDRKSGKKTVSNVLLC